MAAVVASLKENLQNLNEALEEYISVASSCGLLPASENLRLQGYSISDHKRNMAAALARSTVGEFLEGLPISDHNRNMAAALTSLIGNFQTENEALEGLSIADVRRNMTAPVASLTGNLQSLNEALEKAKNHLLQRVQNLDGKIDELREVSKLNEIMDIDAQDDHFPKFFKIILEPRQDLYKLGLPPKFMNEYGNDLLDVVSLTIPNGKTWIVELHKENGKAWLKDGMSKFNVFIFDMTTCEIDYPFNPHKNKGQNIVAENEIVRMNPCSTASSSKGNEMLAKVGQYQKQFGRLNSEHIKQINSYQFEKPSFAVRMHLSQVTYDFRCNVPFKFAKKYLMKSKKNCILKNATGRTWPVQCESKKTYVRFSTGWKKYANNNQLEVRDICVFQLINVAKRQLNVEIVRVQSGAITNDVAGPSNPTKSGGKVTEEEILDG